MKSRNSNCRLYLVTFWGRNDNFALISGWSTVPFDYLQDCNHDVLLMRGVWTVSNRHEGRAIIDTVMEGQSPVFPGGYWYEGPRDLDGLKQQIEAAGAIKARKSQAFHSDGTRRKKEVTT